MPHNELLYNMIFKRKSFHLFTDTQTISKEEFKNIEEYCNNLQPLVKDIKTAIRIVPGKETTCKCKEEYCILLYSEKKDNYLQNIGYIGEQLDLYLASLNIGALWFGMGKSKEATYQGLDFVIMIGIAKVEESKFRDDMFKSKRKSLPEIWKGDHYREIGNLCRFAPSACNLQPWIVETSKKELKVYRYKKFGIMPLDRIMMYYNRIDIGIFLLFLEVCLQRFNISFDRALEVDKNEESTEKTLVAVYKLKG